jgi:hypothetical protein
MAEARQEKSAGALATLLATYLPPPECLLTTEEIVTSWVQASSCPHIRCALQDPQACLPSQVACGRGMGPRHLESKLDSGLDSGEGLSAEKGLLLESLSWTEKGPGWRDHG